MPTFHLTEAKLPADLHGGLEKIRRGVEVVVEEDSRPVALIKRPPGADRSLTECICVAKVEEKKFGVTPVPDVEFAADVRAARVAAW